MPRSVAESLRKQSRECLKVAQATGDPAVRAELLTAAAWLHEEATKIEKLLPARAASFAEDMEFAGGVKVVRGGRS